ncbi:MAG: SigE family RNA polymerase sigma factor [Actinomycetota bacterium]
MMVAQASDRSTIAVGMAAADPASLVVTLFRSEGAALVRLARIFTDDRNAAEDLVQEAFIRLYRSAHRIRDPDRAAAYLRSIVVNLSRDHNRRGLMSLRHQEALTPEACSDALDDRIVRTESQVRVLDALNALPPRQRECLVLRFYLDMTEREIAATLSISPNSVKTHCRRGMATLGIELGALR